VNKSKIEWCDYTWNPVTGCLYGCEYCYARRFAERGLGEYGKHPKGERFLPRFHPERLDEPQKVKKPSRIFVGSMTDMFGYWSDSHVILAVLLAAGDAPWHTYLWLTKNPSHMANFAPFWSEIDWVGATVTHQDDIPNVLRRLERIPDAGVRFISFEPLLNAISLPHYAAEIIDWIIIGAQTGPGAVQPSYQRVGEITKFADAHNIPVFIKNNIVEWPVMRQEFPGAMA
jgi:protein gp37